MQHIGISNGFGDITVMDAREIMKREAHDKLGKKQAVNFIRHSTDVYQEAIRMRGDKTHKSIALLHDVIEDCCPPNMEPDAYAKSIIEDDDIREAVLLLTRLKGQPYANYIEKIATEVGEVGDMARFVKQCDLQVNLRRCVNSERKSLAKRYEKALRRLETVAA